MLHGKKGFDRVVWAFKNVLNSAVTWIFHDYEDKVNPSDGGKLVPSRMMVAVTSAKKKV